jgi:hypothetical protein
MRTGCFEFLVLGLMVFYETVLCYALLRNEIAICNPTMDRGVRKVRPDLGDPANQSLAADPSSAIGRSGPVAWLENIARSAKVAVTDNLIVANCTE